MSGRQRKPSTNQNPNNAAALLYLSECESLIVAEKFTEAKQKLNEIPAKLLGTNQTLLGLYDELRQRANAFQAAYAAPEPKKAIAVSVAHLLPGNTGKQDKPVPAKAISVAYMHPDLPPQRLGPMRPRVDGLDVLAVFLAIIVAPVCLPIILSRLCKYQHQKGPNSPHAHAGDLLFNSKPAKGSSKAQECKAGSKH